MALSWNEIKDRALKFRKNGLMKQKKEPKKILCGMIFLMYLVKYEKE